MTRLENWINKALANVENTEDRRFLRAFATWHHLRRLRRTPKPTTRNQDHHAREDISAAITLLTWLRRHERTLGTWPPADIDIWLSSGKRTQYTARTFVMWAVKNRHARNIEIPAPVSDAEHKALTEDQRWDLIRDLLSNEETDLVDRVAGLLVLLLAQRLCSITALTLDDVMRTGPTVNLRLGTHPLELPPPLDDLVLRLARQREMAPARGSAHTSLWLYDDQVATPRHSDQAEPQRGHDEPRRGHARRCPARQPVPVTMQ